MVGLGDCWPLTIVLNQKWLRMVGSSKKWLVVARMVDSLNHVRRIICYYQPFLTISVTHHGPINPNEPLMYYYEPLSANIYCASSTIKHRLPLIANDGW